MGLFEYRRFLQTDRFGILLLVLCSPEREIAVDQSCEFIVTYIADHGEYGVFRPVKGIVEINDIGFFDDVYALDTSFDEPPVRMFTEDFPDESFASDKRWLFLSLFQCALHQFLLSCKLIGRKRRMHNNVRKKVEALFDILFQNRK